MVTNVSVVGVVKDFNFEEEIYCLEERYSDRLNKKLRREKNTVLYSEDRDCYCFGVGIDWPVKTLIRNCKGVFID